MRIEPGHSLPADKSPTVSQPRSDGSGTYGTHGMAVEVLDLRLKIAEMGCSARIDQITGSAPGTWNDERTIDPSHPSSE